MSSKIVIQLLSQKMQRSPELRENTKQQKNNNNNKIYIYNFILCSSVPFKIQQTLMQDIEMVKTVANIAVSVCILNKSERANMKEVTRNFIK